ncbi:J domain-containing protein, partial [bacterium]|nr:J domain-containing protein [bacterium]
CSACVGRGGSGQQKCGTCNGQGQVRRVTQSLLGQMVNVTACPNCSGTGSTFTNKCSPCQGDGRIKEQDVITIKVPAGVADGNYIPLRGEGNVGRNGGEAGDLIAIIKEKHDEFFTRSGNDILCEVPVSITRLVLGGKITIPTLFGEEVVELSAGTQVGEQIRLRDEGLPSVRSSRKGALIATLTVKIPKKLSAEQKELWKQMDAECKEDDADEERSWLDKAKEFFS